jgi:hypothetical protein
LRNETKAFFLAETQGAHIGSAEARRAAEDGVEYWLQVMRRAGNHAQHLRDRCPMPNYFSQLLLQL